MPNSSSMRASSPSADSITGLNRQPQVVIVVGGASGIGRAAAGLLLQRGARVVCVDRNEAAVVRTSRELDPEARSVIPLVADVTNPPSIRQAVQATLDRWGYCHSLVNCAGITGTTNIRSHEVELDDFDRVLAVNLRGALVVSKSILPVFVSQHYGRLLHIASIAGKEGNAGMVSYSASKAGLIGMVKSMGKEYAQDGITVNALAPAVIRTDLVEMMPEEQVNYMTTRIPMGRIGTLQEAAELIAWIISPAASFTTGFTFDLSGGRATY
ncbi:MAG TPA: SDR family NAD(P)-dependent oxidoreductase [Acidobacteriaceae bacterium]|nr:SDR family NAD(P)-dependent oxidoreductase [Acidobacteriaceae bacterium]